MISFYAAFVAFKLSVLNKTKSRQGLQQKHSDILEYGTILTWNQFYL